MISKEIKFLLSHSSIYGLGTIVSRFVAFMLLPLYTQYLTPGDYGILEIVEITTGLVAIVITIGIASGLSRFYYESQNQQERNKVVSTTYIIYFVLAIFATPLLIFISPYFSEWLLSSSESTNFFVISFLSLILGIFLDIGVLYLRLIKKPVIFTAITLSRLFFLIMFNIIFIVKYEMGVLGILYSSLVVRTFYTLVITVAILWRTKIKFDFRLALSMLKFSIPIIPSNIASTLVKQSDKYFVLHFLSMADTGIYALALRIGNAVHHLFTVPFNLAYVPRRFELMKRDDASYTYAKIFTYYIFTVVFVGLIISVLIPEIVRLMVTPKFYQAAKFIPLVVFSMIIFGTHRHFDFGILYSKKTKYLAYINISTAILNLILNYFLIGSFGLWGGIWSAVLILGLQAFLMYFISNKFFRINFEFQRITRYLLVALIFYFLATQIDFNNLVVNLFLKIILIVLFPVIAIVFKIISKEETQKIKEIYHQKIKQSIIRKFKLKAREV